MRAKTPKKPLKTPPARTRKYSSDPAERAAELVSEGKLGGKQPGAGRPRKSVSEPQSNHPRPASSAVAQAAREHSGLIARAFLDVLDDPDASDRQKMAASKSLVAIELRESALELDEAKQGVAPERVLPEDHGEAVRQLAGLVASNPLVARRLAAVLTSAGPPGDNPPNND
jgi:hypothetical protein